MSLHCDVCNVGVSSEVVMRDHVKGKKHLRLEVWHNRQKEEAARSVYIRDFARGTDKDTVSAYFSQYGKINRVFMDTSKGFYAIVEFEKKESAAKVLGDTHVIGGQRLTVKQREMRMFTPRKKAEPADTGGVELTSPKGVDPEELASLLRKSSSVCEQCSTLLQHLQLSSDDTQLRLLIQDMLQQIVVEFFPGCELYQFGSSVNGLGVRGCDMDLFLDLNLDQPERWPQDTATSTPAALPYVADIPKVKNCSGYGRRGLLSREQLLEIPLYDQVRLVSRILSSSGRVCKNIITIPSARCPVARFSHMITGIKCDISVNNRLALQNTRLIQFYCSLSSSLRPLTYVIRYVAKETGIAGNITSGPKLSNYSLTMMVIFYLQNHPAIKLPSVEKLAELCDEEERKVLGGWDCSFTQQRDRIPDSESTVPLVDLLKGFFGFYSEFEFSSKAVCPRTGQAVELSELMKSPDTRVHTFKIGPICIQDPFVLDHNTTSNVNLKMKNKIVEEMTTMKYKCGLPEFAEANQEEDWGLLLLSAETSSSIPVPLAAKGPMNSDAILRYSFTVDFVSSHVGEKLLSLVTGDLDMMGAWVKSVCCSIHQCLQEGLLLDCKVVSDNTGACTELVEPGPGDININPTPDTDNKAKGETGESEDGEFLNNVQSKTEQEQKDSESNPTVGSLTCEMEMNSTIDAQESCVSSTGPESDNVVETTQSLCTKSAINNDVKGGRDISTGAEGIVEDTNIENLTPKIKQPSVTTEASGSCTDSQEIKLCAGEDGKTIGKSAANTAVESQRPSAADSLFKGLGIAPSQSQDVKSPSSTMDGVESTDLSGAHVSESFQSTLGKRLSPDSGIGGRESKRCRSDFDNMEEEKEEEEKEEEKKGDIDTAQTKETNRKSLMELSCTTRHRVWVSRKKHRKEIVQACSSVVDNLALEKLISQRIQQGETAHTKVLFAFSVLLEQLAGQNAVYVTFVPTEGAKEFSCFYSFLKTFLVKMVDKHFH